MDANILVYVQYIIVDIEQFQPSSDQGFFPLVLKLGVFKTSLDNLDYVQCVMIMSQKMKLTLYFIVINIMICENICMRRYSQNINNFEILSDTETFNIVMSSVFVKHTAEYLYKAYHKRRSLIYN